MLGTSFLTRSTRMAALLAAVLTFAALAGGCASKPKAEAPRGGAETPIESSKLVRGALPGVQIVAVAKLPKADQQAIASWQQGDKSGDQAPTLKAGTFTPDIDGHVLEAARGVGSDNGIATSIITLTFDPEGTKLLTDLTAAQVDQELAVVIGGRVVSAPTIVEPITSGQIEISASRESIDAIAKQIVPAP